MRKCYLGETPPKHSQIKCPKALLASVSITLRNRCVDKLNPSETLLEPERGTHYFRKLEHLLTCVQPHSDLSFQNPGKFAITRPILRLILRPATDTSSKFFLVLGHWMMDYCATLPAGLSLSAPLPASHIHANVVSQVGGSAYHFAKALIAAGCRDVRSVACIGDDLIGRVIVEEAEEQSISVFARVGEGATSTTVLIYDSTDFRISIGDQESNRPTVRESIKYIRENTPALTFIAGHVINLDGGWKEFINLLRDLRSQGTKIIIDMVPHNIQTLICQDLRDELLAHIDAVIGSPAALRPFLNYSSEIPCDKLVQELLNKLEWVCVHPTNQLIVVGSRNKSGGTTVYERATGYNEKEIKAGGLDESVAEELWKHFKSE